MNEHLILYDGTCGLCHGIVRYLVKHDKEKKFLFAPLQGETAKKFSLPNTDSIILLKNYKSDPIFFIKGKASCEILAILHPWLKFLRYLPKMVVNPPYSFVAAIRYKVFPRQVCLVPAKLDRSRFLP